MILYDAARCPYCARARIVLAEKGLGYETVEIDLSDRPGWLYVKNPSGTVPVLEEDGGFVLPESLVIMEYLEERFPQPPLWPADPAERALGRLWLDRFDVRLGVDLEPYPALSAWLERLSERPTIAAELELTTALGR